ncbi:thiopeptide-type bacteriocin biosynthesis protein [Streptomyces albulus]|nr:thiopeptide-type bacteriocin biosynthesis protein [Streptomyces noursei]
MRGGAPDGALRAQVTFRPGHARHGNAAQVPQWLDRLLPVGCFADPDDPGVLDPRRLAVRAEPDRLRLVDSATGRPVDPAVFHLLTPQWDLPDVARFAAELAEGGTRPWRAWDWGGADVLPYLPRVRYGRTVLAPARWRPAPNSSTPGCRSRSGGMPGSSGRSGGGPRTAVGGTAGPGRPGRPVAARTSGAAAARVVAVRPGRTARGAGRCRGPPGRLAARPDGATTPKSSSPAPGPGRGPAGPSPPAVRRHVAPRATAGVHLPGGEWPSTAWYAPAERHEELLVGHLPGLLEQLPAEVDRWFFERRRDAYGAHLRLRFHAPPEVLAGRLLPRLHDTTGRLRADGLLGRVVCDAYDPELERYGGPEAIAAAERVFHADSVTVVEHLRRRFARQDGAEPLLLAAAGLADLARLPRRRRRGLRTGRRASRGCGLVVAVRAEGRQAHRAFRERRRQVLSLVDPYRSVQGRPPPGTCCAPRGSAAENRRRVTAGCCADWASAPGATRTRCCGGSSRRTTTGWSVSTRSPRAWPTRWPAVRPRRTPIAGGRAGDRSHGSRPAGSC